MGVARRHYRTEVAPGLAGVPHAAALLGNGSEVLGYDDEVSTDHDFGPRVQVFLPVLSDLGELPVGVSVDTVETFFVAWLGVDPAAGSSSAGSSGDGLSHAGSSGDG